MTEKKINFTLAQIQQLVEQELNLKWTDRMVVNIDPRSYHSANLYWDFVYDKSTYLYLRNDKDKRFLAKVKVDNEQFIINFNGKIIDATEHWLEIIGQQYTL